MTAIWETLGKVRCWTPLAELPLEPIRVAEGVYRVGADAYVVAIEHDKEWKPSRAGPLMTTLIWAGSDAGASVAVGARAAARCPLPESVPPEGLVPAGAPNYGRLTAALRAVHGRWMEREVGDSDGNLLARTVDWGGHAAYFRDPPGEDDPPVAISIALPE